MGRIRNAKSGLVRATNDDKDGYPRLNLSMNGKTGVFHVHRLVALTFIGPPPKGRPQVAHWDGNPKNNALSNLRYASASENTLDKVRHGRMPARKTSVIGATQRGQSWQAQICINGKSTYLGSFPDAESASKAYWDKKREIENHKIEV
jgi:hypothetical protein